MKKLTKQDVKAIEEIIAKYRDPQKTMNEWMSIYDCPLCDIYFFDELECNSNCPNYRINGENSWDCGGLARDTWRLLLDAHNEWDWQWEDKELTNNLIQAASKRADALQKIVDEWYENNT